MFAAAWLCGCAGPRDSIRADGASGSLVPTPPAFVAGAASLLLTNQEGFSARVAEERPPTAGKKHELTGRLVGQGGRLFFVPEGRGMSYIWDASAHGGYLLSEPLQSYAPMVSRPWPEKVTLDPAKSGHASVNGHDCEITGATVENTDGSTSRFTIWRAGDLLGFPVRIQCLDAAHPFTLNLLDVRREPVRPGLFLPPDGFSKYADAETMMTELLSRQAALRGKKGSRANDDIMEMQEGHGPPKRY